MNLRDFEPFLSTTHDKMAKPGWLPSHDRSRESSTLTKADLADALFERIGLSKREAKEIVDAFFDVIAETLESGENTRLSSFGNFRLREKKQRLGCNPKTGETVPIAARRVVLFHPSQKLNASINVGVK
ncbi:integration host factor subunit alpha [Caballeronia sp. DA-9]|uniref:integration host factor subunit alpha n=1 Tax=Caballeronia sp. DA-9 TaxID=3436237 RepID=UPI003F66E317